MPNQIYQILPVFEERLWGGQRLRERFGYQSDLKNIAEVYNVIAIPGHLDCTVADTGEKLSLFYHTHRELFNCETPEMPVRMIMCAAKGTAVHPDSPGRRLRAGPRRDEGKAGRLPRPGVRRGFPYAPRAFCENPGGV